MSMRACARQHRRSSRTRSSWATFPRRSPPSGRWTRSRWRRAPGELLAITGPSGAGKTTLCRIIAGLETPDAGVCRIAGRDVASVPAAARRVAYMFEVLRALSAPDGAGERDVAPDRAERSRDRHRRRRRLAGCPRDTPPECAVAGRVVRRPEAAGRARAHPRPKARRDAARRADLPSRRQAAPQAALRDPPHRHVAAIADALVHARCDGSAVGRGSRCRHRRGPHRADRHAGGTVAPAGDGAGGTPRRRSADEPASGTPRIPCGPGARHSCAPSFAFR